MKNLLLIAGLILIILNTLVGLLISQYMPFNYWMVNFSLLLSTVLVYVFSNSNISAGYKIGLNLLFGITGLIKVICLIAAEPHIKDNILIVMFLGLSAFEIVCLFSAFAMRKFS